MTLATIIPANEILNRVAAEVGIEPVSDPFSSKDPAFLKMRYLLNTAGEELMQSYPWEFLTRSHQITTSSLDSGSYPLPDDFGYMINQTGWERNENVPLGGPLSPQEWTYLQGRDLASNTLYASFRISEGQFNVYPIPPPDGLDINFEYITTEWVTNGQVNPTYQSEVITGTDKPLFDKTLISRYVKLKWLEAGGFDTSKAQADFNMVFNFTTGHNAAAPVLNAGRGHGGLPYLSNYNLPDTGFGL